jgi:hypothetical protein
MPSVACPVQGEDAAGWIGFRLTFDKSGYLQHRSNESAAELLKAAMIIFVGRSKPTTCPENVR